MILSAFTGWAVEALIASALLMAIVLLARAPVRRAFGPQVAYALWTLPLLRLLLPPLPADWREQVATPITRAGEAVTILIVPGYAPAQTALPVAQSVLAALPWGIIAAMAWAIGALAFFAVHLLRHRRFCRRMLADARLVDQVDGIRVIESAAASGPLAFGIARRFVAFPRDFADRYDADERALALAHEIGHHRRGDLFANWAALAVLALHWFNPLAWRAFRAFRCDQELANDARVLAGRSRTDRHIYACAILKAAHGGAISAACHLHTIDDLKGRLRMLTHSRVSRTRLVTGTAAVLALVTTGLAATASGTRAAAAMSEEIEAATGVKLQQPTPPTPPAPPAPTSKTVKRVVVVKDGKTRLYEGARADAYTATHPVPPVPPVPPAPALAPVHGKHVKVIVRDRNGDLRSQAFGDLPKRGDVPFVESMDCPDRGDRRMSFEDHRGGQRRVVICTDRIEAAAQAAAAVYVDHRRVHRDATAQALQSLRATRESMLANRDMSEDERREVASSLNEAIRELEGEIASAGRN